MFLSSLCSSSRPAEPCHLEFVAAGPGQPSTLVQHMILEVHCCHGMKRYMYQIPEVPSKQLHTWNRVHPRWLAMQSIHTVARWVYWDPTLSPAPRSTATRLAPPLESSGKGLGCLARLKLHGSFQSTYQGFWEIDFFPQRLKKSLWN